MPESVIVAVSCVPHLPCKALDQPLTSSTSLLTPVRLLCYEQVESIVHFAPARTVVALTSSPDCAVMPVFTPPSRFAGLSLYAVLGVEKSAANDDIKRGYRRAALKYHPDHNRSPDANDEFGYLAHAHDILSNDATRTLYDETGMHDSSSYASSSTDSSVSSTDYWRSVFPQVTVDEIEAFREKYVGSEEEVEDIKAAYQRYEGNVQHVLDSIPFAEADSVARLCQLLNQHCKARITAQQQKRLQKKAEEWQRQEEADFEQLTLSGSTEEKEAAQTAGDMTQLVALLTRRKEEAKEKQEQWLAYMGDKYGGGADKQKRLTKGKAASSKQSKSKANGKGSSMADGEEEKEAGIEEKDGDEPSEEEFQRIQAAMLQRREANKANGATNGKPSAKKVNGATERDKKRRKTNK